MTTPTSCRRIHHAPERQHTQYSGACSTMQYSSTDVHVCTHQAQHDDLSCLQLVVHAALDVDEDEQRVDDALAHLAHHDLVDHLRVRGEEGGVMTQRWMAAEHTDLTNHLCVREEAKQ